ncbi:hypothetical protein L6452_02361 [Arctium lappa]|uniref:Uncharacterized protein n=1 Tax=Arctium lappa TaxID=4217 RepID=A0ACB9FJE0_ARCLA|nr:hypothetical protein L6452_02361 [Arctium lappa]
MTIDEGSTIVISDETGSLSVGSKPKKADEKSAPMPKKREYSMLDTLAAAEVRENEDTPPVSPVVQLRDLLHSSPLQSQGNPPSSPMEQMIEDTPTASPTSSPPYLSNESQSQLNTCTESLCGWENLEKQGENEKNQAGPSGGDPKQPKRGTRKKQNVAMEGEAIPLWNGQSPFSVLKALKI